jgi:hypothetical protein
VTQPIIDLTFPRNWQAEILPSRPLILPQHHLTYPLYAEEVEQGALEVLIHPDQKPQPFLATCALGFRAPQVPTGVWSAPNPDEICVASGGYAYLIDAICPTRFTMIAFRPVLELRPLLEQGLLLFVGHRALLGWGVNGHAWQSEKLSDEGLTITAITGRELNGQGWNMLTDKETAFTLDLKTGQRV